MFFSNVPPILQAAANVCSNIGGQPRQIRHSQRFLRDAIITSGGADILSVVTPPTSHRLSGSFQLRYDRCRDGRVASPCRQKTAGFPNRYSVFARIVTAIAAGILAAVATCCISECFSRPAKRPTCGDSPAHKVGTAGAFGLGEVCGAFVSPSKIRLFLMNDKEMHGYTACLCPFSNMKCGRGAAKPRSRKMSIA